MTKEPEPKNPIIANFFHQVRLADELGSGVRNLYHYVKIYSNAEPVFDEDDVFRLIVPLDDEYSADRALEGALTKTAQETAQDTMQQGSVKSSVKTVEKTVERIMLLLSENPHATQKFIAEHTGLSRRGV